MPTALAAPAQGYVPRSARNDLKAIIEDWLEELLHHECRIHCYGAISTTIRRKFGWVKKEGEGDESSGGVDVTVAEEESEFVVAEEESEFVKLRKQ